MTNIGGVNCLLFHYVGALRMFLYSAFMFIMIKVHTFPLFSIRPMYLALRYVTCESVRDETSS